MRHYDAKCSTSFAPRACWRPTWQSECSAGATRASRCITAPRSKATDSEGRQHLARYIIRCPFALEKMRYDPGSGMVIYRSKLHATLKRHYQLMPGLKWLRLLMNHIPDKYEHLGTATTATIPTARAVPEDWRNRPATRHQALLSTTRPVDTARSANWARLIQKVYEVDSLECTPPRRHTLRIIALIDDGDVVKQILKHLNVWDPPPDTIASTGPDPPVPKGETLPLTYHPVPDIA